jgi:hypothetical protein
MASLCGCASSSIQLSLSLNPIESITSARDESKTADAREVTPADGRKILSGSPDDGGPKY